MTSFASLTPTFSFSRVSPVGSTTFLAEEFVAAEACNDGGGVANPTVPESFAQVLSFVTDSVGFSPAAMTASISEMEVRFCSIGSITAGACSLIDIGTVRSMNSVIATAMTRPPQAPHKYSERRRKRKINGPASETIKPRSRRILCC